MRKIGIPEIEDIATGAALLGAGGGGDPYVGKLVAIGAVQECGPVTLLDPAEVPDDALAAMAKLQALTGVPVPTPLAELQTLPVLHHDCIEVSEMADYVRRKMEG